jgi:hypothetical protein
MAKTCPGCGYHPIGPFTDNCPVCAEPVRNVRSDRGRGGWGGPGVFGLPPVAQWVLGALLVTLLGCGGCCGFGAWFGGQKAEELREQAEREREAAEANRKARTVTVTAGPLLQAFEADPAAGDETYKGKYLHLTGVVERVGTDPDERPFVVLHGGDEKAKLRVECFFRPSSDEEDDALRKLTKGQQVTVRGEFRGRVTNVQLRECALDK